MYVFILTPTVSPTPTPMNAHRAEAGGARPQGPDIGQGRAVPPALRRGGQAAIPSVRSLRQWQGDGVFGGGKSGGVVAAGAGGVGMVGGGVCESSRAIKVLNVQQWKGRAGGGGHGEFRRWAVVSSPLRCPMCVYPHTPNVDKTNCVTHRRGTPNQPGATEQQRRRE